VTKGGSGLVLLDEKGQERAALGLTKDGSILGLSDENGNPRASLGATKLNMLDEKGKVIWKAP
jgi:hypothetical protein